MSIFLVTAPSGSGKTSIMNRVVESLNKSFLIKKKTIGECISHTTREMRDGEIDRVTYYYKTKIEFDHMKKLDEFAESVIYDGNHYGISKEEINRVLKTYKHVYIIVNYDGYKQVKKAFPNAVGIFLHMSKEDCLANMLLRGDSMDNAMKRFNTYDEEMANKHDFDYVVKNIRWKMDETVEIIKDIIIQNS